MSCHISVRDIDFHASATGVRIRVTTDVPSHLFVRLSSQEPWVHMQPSIRRGVAFAEDVRFCFTVFEDNEQFESGDTLEHTWWKKGWPVCTTKWLYIWGMRSGEVCQSTTAPFKYHNTGEAPVPPPDSMHQLNAIDPEHYGIAVGTSWAYIDVSRDVPEDATGVLLWLMNENTGMDVNVALRKPGASHDNFFPMFKNSVQSVIVGLDASRRFQARTGAAGSIKCYVMGYTGRDVVFPDSCIDIKPATDNVYSTFDIHATWPEAKFILTDMGTHNGFNDYHSIRPLGSSKEVYQGTGHKFPFCNVPAGGQIQTKLYKRGHISTRWVAYAYFKKDVAQSLNGHALTPLTPYAWNDCDVYPFGPDTLFAFVEYLDGYSATTVCIRKDSSYFNAARGNANHTWLITHVHMNRILELKAGGDPQVALALAVITD